MIVKHSIILIVTCFLFSFIVSQDPGEDGPTYIVDPTCGDSCEANTFPSIASALAALPAEGGTIFLGEGVYVGPDNKNLQITTPVTIRTESGDPTSAVVDCQGDGYAFTADGVSILFNGFTITNCVSDRGAALEVENGVNTTLIAMVFTGNVVTGNGGAVWQSGGALSVIGCQFFGNDAVLGSAIQVVGTATVITGSVFNDNDVDEGHVVACVADGSITFQGDNPMNNDDIGAIADDLCPECVIFIDTDNLCDDGPPVAEPVTPPVTPPPPQAPAPPPPVSPPPPPQQPVSPPPPQAPAPTVPPSFGGPPPVLVPIFDGPSFGSGSSMFISTFAVIGCSLVLMMF